jgi:hypothetical protein
MAAGDVVGKERASFLSDILEPPKCAGTDHKSSRNDLREMAVCKRMDRQGGRCVVQ